ncbi:MAG: energy-coupling factor transporter transmembrane component T [Oscillospiraceae bacterium]|nr:energy-coupling factor transporter transmembrane component T [Oscillospiraceae bacterium]
MLKDITLGQYFPGNSFIHRLDPRTKLICTIIYIAALFAAKSYVTYGILFIILCLSVAVSKIRPAALLKGLKPLALIIIFTAVLNLFYIKGGRELLSFWTLSITTEGIKTAFFMVIRIMMLITGTFLLTYTTTPMALTDGLELIMNPLKKIRVPVHEFSMMMSIALRFIPTLIEEADKITNAQKARGADFENGKLTERAKALLPLLVPLFVSAFRRADELAVAMESRCYHGGEGRTRMKKLSMRASDYVTALSSLVFLAGIIFLAREGL